MSVLRGLERRSAETLAQRLELAGRDVRSSAGVTVTTDSAMRNSAVWACVNLLADLVSTLPIDVYERRTVGELPVEIEAPPLIAGPSGIVSPINWRRQVLVSWLLRGNVFGIIANRDARYIPTQIEILHPDDVQVQWGQDGKLTYRVRNVEVPTDDIWHVPAYTIPGSPIGMSPISYARQAIGLGLAAENFGAEWFNDGSHPSAILSVDAPKIDEEQAKIVKQRFREATAGNREIAVLANSVKYQAIQVSPDESQFLDTMRANVATIARFFRIPPEMIGGESGNSLTYANVEQRSLDMLTYTVNSWVCRFEESLSALLLKPQFVKLNIDALVRVDTSTRYSAHANAIRTGWKSRNEIRRIENLPPIPDGDEYLWPPYRAFPIDSDQDS